MMWNHWQSSCITTRGIRTDITSVSGYLMLWGIDPTVTEIGYA